jgi:uracil-DNA glycosylase
MNESLRSELAAWLEFYRELGIDEFYRRQAGPGTAAFSPSAVQWTLAQENPLSTAPLPAATGHEVPAEAQSPAAGARASAAVQVPNPTPHPALSPGERVPVTAGAGKDVSLRPRTPAHALNLFEAPAPGRSGHETLDEIRAALGDCQRCKLAGGRKHIVFGQGNPAARLVFIGEGPGADEDEQGLPFVGRAGQLLNRMLQFVGIKREDVYICNVVKCRPPGNRVPEPDEVDTCSPFLFRQLESIRPRLICCLGAPAVRTVLGLKDGILKIRGRFYEYGGAKALATVHPAYVLRNPREEKILREDFEKIRDFLKRTG